MHNVGKTCGANRDVAVQVRRGVVQAVRMTSPTQAAISLTETVLSLPDEERVPFLRDVLAYAAGALVAIEGPERASEHVFRVADAAVGQRP